MRVVRVVVMALMILALFASVASADEGGIAPNIVPYDPGLPSSQTPPPAPPSSFTE
jgi:hypothetical protein